MSHHVRRTDRAITDPAHIESIIERGRYCTFALIDGEEPYAVALSYGYDACARRMYFHVAHAGHKLDVIRRNPSACGHIVIDHGYTQGECEHPFESAVLRGRMRIVEDDEEKRHALQVLIGHLEDDATAFWESRGLDDAAEYQRFTALCFEIGSVTAKRGK
ncbi:MAG: hypothetical protein Kow0067_03250 [Coriobacteriia bacterium]